MAGQREPCPQKSTRGSFDCRPCPLKLAPPSGEFRFPSGDLNIKEGVPAGQTPQLAQADLSRRPPSAYLHRQPCYRQARHREGDHELGKGRDQLLALIPGPNDVVEPILFPTQLKPKSAPAQTGPRSQTARALAERAVADSPTSASRVRALLLLGFIEWDAGAVESVFEYMDQSLAAAGDDRDLQRDVCMAWVYVTRTLDPKRALEFAERAEALLGGEADPHQVLLFDRFWAEALLGRKPRLELLERGLDLEAATGPHRLIPILWYTATDDFGAARARHELEDAWSRERGDERMRCDRLAYRAVVELRAGRWDLAEEYVERSCSLIEGLDFGRAHAVAFGWRSLVDAHRGRLDRARSTLLPLLDEVERTNARTWWVERLLAILGFVEFNAGDHEAADRALVQMRVVYDSMGVAEPLLDWSEPFQVESLLAIGELGRAREALARLEERGRRFPRLWIDVTLPRARGLVLAAEDDLVAALAALERLDRATASQLPFELGWALLARGQLLRRTKQRRAAATALSEALQIFDRLGAPTWIERTRAELARVAPRRRAPDELTETERLVAELAATGLTNREVAKAAFVSTKTVEANLARVYRKLGIRSRAELGARIGARPGGDETRT